MTTPLSLEEYHDAVARQQEPDCAAIFSGGMDSTVLVYQLIEEGHWPHVISFNYGQRHNKELGFAQATAQKIGLKHDIVDLTGITHLISNSALTGHKDHGQVEMNPIIEVPEGHYAEDNMKLTVVPNRNMIMLSIAAGIAVNNSYKFIATGVHAGDHFVYPDCRPEFIQSVNDTIIYGNQGFGSIKKQEGATLDKFIEAPFINKTKADIALRGIELGVPFEDTWSCYKGEVMHCGKCGTCVERLEAIDEAGRRYDASAYALVPGIYDRTPYEDDTFWKEAVKRG